FPASWQVRKDRLAGGPVSYDVSVFWIINLTRQRLPYASQALAIEFGDDSIPKFGRNLWPALWALMTLLGTLKCLDVARRKEIRFPARSVTLILSAILLIVACALELSMVA